jgi:hypothetical protein
MYVSLRVAEGAALLAFPAMQAVYSIGTLHFISPLYFLFLFLFYLLLL